MIRKANKNDIPGVISLLFQVNAVHHEIRPDLFKGNTVKYKEKELAELLNDESKPIFVYVDEDGNILGHAFCQIIDIKNNAVRWIVARISVATKIALCAWGSNRHIRR